MKTKIYLLSWVSFTGSDNYMYSDIQTFTDKDKAKAEFLRQKDNAYEECKWGSEWESEDKEDAYEFDVYEKTNSDECYEVHSEAYDGYDVEIYLREKEIEIGQPKKMYVVFGQTPNNLMGNGEWKQLADYWKDDPSAIGMREFDSDAEAVAYLHGINDSLGWEDASCLEPEQIAELDKYMELEEVGTPCEF